MITVHGIVNDLKLVPVGFVDSSEYLSCRSTLFNFWGLGKFLKGDLIKVSVFASY